MLDVVSMYGKMLVSMVVASDTTKVRLYRKLDHRLSVKCTTITAWYTRRSDISSDNVVYVDIPKNLIAGYESSMRGVYKLKGAARTYAQRSWKRL